MIASTSARVAVVVATRDRADRVMRLLDALDAQEGAPPFEVVVVDDGSQDGTAHRVEERRPKASFPIRLLRQNQPTGPAEARNRGWHETAAELIAFTDDDCLPPPNWLRNLVGSLDRDSADLVAGVTTYPADQAHLRATWSYWMDDDGRRGHYSTSNIGYRRHVLLATGGFNADEFSYRSRRGGGARCINGEDTDLAWRAIAAGFRSTLAPDAVVYHDVFPLTWRASLRNVPRLAGLVLLFKKHPHLRTQFGRSLFYRRVDAASLVVLGSIAGLTFRRARPLALVGLLMGGAWYVHLFRRSHVPPAGVGGYLVAVPLGFVSDSYATLVMLRASLRYRTLLL